MICWLTLLAVVAWCVIAWWRVPEDPLDIDSGYPEHEFADRTPNGVCCPSEPDELSAWMQTLPRRDE